MPIRKWLLTRLLNLFRLLFCSWSRPSYINTICIVVCLFSSNSNWKLFRCSMLNANGMCKFRLERWVQYINVKGYFLSSIRWDQWCVRCVTHFLHYYFTLHFPLNTLWNQVKSISPMKANECSSFITNHISIVSNDRQQINKAKFYFNAHSSE